MMDRPEIAEPASAPEAGAALICSDARPLAMLGRQLRRAVGSLDLLPSLPPTDHWSRYSLVAIHYDDLHAEDRARLVRDLTAMSGPTLLLLSRRLDRPALASLFQNHILTNLLVIDENGPDMADLLVTLQKLRRGDIFGLEKYFVWGVDPRVVQVRRSADRFTALDAVAAYTREIGIPSRLRAAIRTVADEFLSNALYNAPTHPDGTPRYADRSRTESVELLPHEEVVFRYCCDGRRFGMAVEDPFGSITPSRVQQFLGRAMRAGADQVVQGTGGAGLGLYHILDALSHFVIGIEPGRRTEMIGLIDVSSGFRRFAEAGKSFNLFVTESRP